MSYPMTIPGNGANAIRRTNSFIVLAIVSLLIGTFLRISLLFLYPFLALFIASFYKFRITASLIWLLALSGLSLSLSFFKGGFLSYKLLSLYHILPFLLLLFARPCIEKETGAGHLRIFLSCLTAVAILNNLIGLVQIFVNPHSDDSFTGLYSMYSVSLNGLSILNMVLFFYYAALFTYSGKRLDLAAAVFFLACSVLGFYGAGLIIGIATFILGFFRFRIKAFLRTAIIAIVSLATIYFSMLLIKPQVLDYNMANIKKIASFDVQNGPRKLISFYNYTISYPHNIKDFLFGSGPGTFNSRSAFMVGSPSYFTKLDFIKSDEQPYYFRNYAYPLWNETNTSQALYLDGFRNQPFSSLLAFLGEYGAVFTLAFFVLYYLYYRQVANIHHHLKTIRQARAYFRFFKYNIILLPMLLLIDNYFEYPEIMLLVILSIKFSHMALLSISKNVAVHEP